MPFNIICLTTFTKKVTEWNGEKNNLASEVSVDGFIEGPNGEMDWAMMEDEETWRDAL